MYVHFSLQSSGQPSTGRGKLDIYEREYSHGLSANRSDIPKSPREKSKCAVQEPKETRRESSSVEGNGGDDLNHYLEGRREDTDRRCEVADFGSDRENCGRIDILTRAVQEIAGEGEDED